MNKTSETGKLGEDLACEYLLKKGWKILQRNFRKPWGELDIIAKDSMRILVFVEVKTIRLYQGPDGQTQQPSSVAIQPEENLTVAKLRKLQRTASLYVGHHPELLNDRGWRIDLVAITLAGPKSLIKHFENI